MSENKTTLDLMQGKSIFFVSSPKTYATFANAARLLGARAIAFEDEATPGSLWTDVLRRCLEKSDVVVGILGESTEDANVYYELGAAFALGRPTLLILTSDHAPHMIPVGLSYLRASVDDEEAIRFCLRQALSMAVPESPRKHGFAYKTKPIGPTQSTLRERLQTANAAEFENIIHDALSASGPSMIVRGGPAGDLGVDFAVWSSDLEPLITNPLLIECKHSISSRAQVDQIVGRAIRVMSSIRNGFFVVVYKESRLSGRLNTQAPPIAFVSADEFLKSLESEGLAYYVRSLRNQVVHGVR